MKHILFILLLLVLNNAYSLDASEETLLRIEAQNILIIENNSQMFGFQLAYLSVVVLLLGYIAGRQR